MKTEKPQKITKTKAVKAVVLPVQNTLPAVSNPKEILLLNEKPFAVRVKEGYESLADGSKTLVDIGRDLKLTINQITFCKLYVSDEFRGNATKSYAEAYDMDIEFDQGRIEAQSSANTLLKHEGVKLLINILLYGSGLNAENLDVQLSLLVNQNYDPSLKLKAIQESNKVLGRITKKAEITHVHKQAIDYSMLTPAELETLIRLVDKAHIERLD